MKKEIRSTAEIEALNKDLVNSVGNNGDRRPDLAFIDGANWQRNYCFEHMDLRKPVTSSADLDKMARKYTSGITEASAAIIPARVVDDAFKAGFAAAKLDNLDKPAAPQAEVSIGGFDVLMSELRAYGAAYVHVDDEGEWKFIPLRNIQIHDVQPPAEIGVGFREEFQSIRNLIEDFRDLVSIDLGYIRVENHEALLSRMEVISKDASNNQDYNAEKIGEILTLMRADRALDAAEPVGGEAGRVYDDTLAKAYQEAIRRVDDQPQFKRTFEDPEDALARHMFGSILGGVDLTKGGDVTAYAIGYNDKLYPVCKEVSDAFKEQQAIIKNQEALTAEQAEDIRQFKDAEAHYRGLAKVRNDEIARLQTKLDDLRALIDK